MKLTYKLDGSASKNMGAGRAAARRPSKSPRRCGLPIRIVVTTMTGAGEEKRTFSMEGDNLVVETSAPARTGGAPNITKLTYQTYERGLGG